MTVKLNPQKIEGKWKSGIALDFHTTSSTPIGNNEFGHMQFETLRPEIAELLFQLKYRNSQTSGPKIIEAASGFLISHRTKFNLMIPVPPSATRAVQPVIVLANGIGSAIGLPVADCITKTRPTNELKGVTDLAARKLLLEGLYSVDSIQTKGKRILLFDDLYRSGATMNAITDMLFAQGEVASVSVLTITKTRSNQ